MKIKVATIFNKVFQGFKSTIFCFHYHSKIELKLKFLFLRSKKSSILNFKLIKEIKKIYTTGLLSFELNIFFFKNK